MMNDIWSDYVIICLNLLTKLFKINWDNPWKTLGRWVVGRVLFGIIVVVYTLVVVDGFFVEVFCNFSDSVLFLVVGDLDVVIGFKVVEIELDRCGVVDLVVCVVVLEAREVVGLVVCVVVLVGREVVGLVVCVVVLVGREVVGLVVFVVVLVGREVVGVVVIEGGEFVGLVGCVVVLEGEVVGLVVCDVVLEGREVVGLVVWALATTMFIWRFSLIFIEEMFCFVVGVVRAIFVVVSIILFIFLVISWVETIGVFIEALLIINGSSVETNRLSSSLGFNICICKLEKI